MPPHETVTCPRCGAPFECKLGSIDLCHCAAAQLTEEQQLDIEAQYEGCLCLECLCEISAKAD
ncbi:MAG: cysteine-rich CWC family protein [Pseudomonadota bacterium]